MWLQVSLTEVPTLALLNAWQSKGARDCRDARCLQSTWPRLNLKELLLKNCLHSMSLKTLLVDFSNIEISFKFQPSQCRKYCMLFLKPLASFLKRRRHLHKLHRRIFFIATFLHLLGKWSLTVNRISGWCQNTGLTR